MQKLTLAGLAVPPRIVTDYLDGLKINCEHCKRGCSEIMELGTLETHAAKCMYRPVCCPNDECTVVVHMRDLEEHKTKGCEYKLIRCHECNEKMSLTKYGKHACLLKKEVDQLKVLLFDIKNQVTKMQETQDKKFEEVLAEIQKLSLISLSVANNTTPSPILIEQKNNIVILGGMNNRYGKSLNTVEMYTSLGSSWTQLQPMTECRASATAHCCSGQIIVTGGHNEWQSTDSTETVFLGTVPKQWYSCPYELPATCHGHKTAIHNNYLWSIGGSTDTFSYSNAISKVCLQPPFCTTLEAELPQPVSYHGLEIIEDNIIVLGGSPTGKSNDAVDTVLSYNMLTKEIVQLMPLPFPMLDLATVRIGVDVLIIGGTNRQCRSLNTVFKYNCKTMHCSQLPSMKYKRSECAAVVSGNQVFVMGGECLGEGYLSSVECFNVYNQSWVELPSMNEAKSKLAAVCAPTHLF